MEGKARVAEVGLEAKAELAVQGASVEQEISKGSRLS